MVPDGLFAPVTTLVACDFVRAIKANLQHNAVPMSRPYRAAKGLNCVFPI
jgi:hypothetical protein